MGFLFLLYDFCLELDLFFCFFIIFMLKLFFCFIFFLVWCLCGRVFWEMFVGFWRMFFYFLYLGSFFFDVDNFVLNGVWIFWIFCCFVEEILMVYLLYENKLYLNLGCVIKGIKKCFILKFSVWWLLYWYKFYNFLKEFSYRIYNYWIRVKFLLVCINVYMY